MKDKEYLEALKSFEELDSNQNASAVHEEKIEVYDKDDERRKLTYKIEDNVAEMMNYTSIIEKSKKSFKKAKKDYRKAKKEYDGKSFSALVFDILAFLGVVFTVYFFIKRNQNEGKAIFEICLYIFVAFTVCAFAIALYKHFKIRPYKKKMKSAKELMRNSKIWIDESERGMKDVEDENRSLKKQRKNV